MVVLTDLGTWGKLLRLFPREPEDASSPLPTYGWQTSLSPTPLQSPWGFALRFYGLKGSIWVAGARELLLSGRIKPAQLAARAEAPEWISPVSTVKLEHNKSKFWQISIISFPTTFFSWLQFASDSRWILGTAQAIIQSMYIAPCISQHAPPQWPSGSNSVLSPLPVLPKSSWLCVYSSHIDSPILLRRAGLSFLKKWRHQEVE